MTNTVFVPTAIAAKDVDAYNRSGVATQDIMNGTPVVCGDLSTDIKKKFVFDVTLPDAPMSGLWMAYSPESILTTDGIANFANIQLDPRAFTNLAGKTFDIFKPKKGDIFQITKEWFAEGASPVEVAGATYVEINSTGEMSAVVTPTTAFEGLQFKILKELPIAIGSGGIGDENVPAWLLECTIN